MADVRPDARDKRIEVLIRREFAQPIDPDGAVGLRAHLIDSTDGRFVLVAVARRGEWDATSWKLFFDYVSAHYSDRELPELVTPTEPPAVGRIAAGDAEHWRMLLCPTPGRPALPGSRASRTAGVAAARLRHAIAISPDTVTRLRSVATELTVDPSALLLTALNSVLFRWTGTSDFLVSIPVDSRGNHAAIGNYERSVLVRSGLSGDARFTDLVVRTDAAYRTASRHQNCGVATAATELGLDAPVAPTDVVFETRHRHEEFTLDGVAATRLLPVDATTDTALDVTVSLPRTESGGGDLDITCRTGTLEPAALRGLADAVVHLLGAALRTPNARIDTIELFGDDARSAVLAASHGPVVPVPAGTLVAMMEQSVAASPDHVALASDTEQLTYSELNARANRLAHSLIGAGIGTEDVVAVRLDGLTDTVTAMLGILKSGAAYLPIDPDYPSHHVDYLLDDAQPLRVVDALPADADLPDTNPTDDDRLRPLRPDNLAYVMYSSGSTGIPKGVLVSHRAIAEHLAGLREEFALDADDRLLQTSSIGFDASLLEIFHTLAAGARLIVPKSDAARDYPYIADLIVRHRATVVHMVPSMLRTFLLLSKVNEWIGVRHIPVGGEPLPGDVADRLGTVCDAALTNNYGPTEAIVSATRFPIVSGQGTRTVPIGTPNRNVYLYLLDSSLRLIPDGAVGEIYLGGNQLARGYANLPGRTAERFVADPFSDGGLLFRTGDLARRTGGGIIEFVGRADADVTIRGMQVDLGEVESAVTSHPAVEHCVVLPTETAEGRVLAAYLVTDATAPPVDLRAVHRHVAELLPEYLAPKAFAVIDEVPVTAHGKLDQLALPTATLLVDR